jgi:hypothetical protein
MIRRVMMAPLSPQCGYPLAFRGIWGAENVGEFDYLTRQRSGLSRGEVNGEFVHVVTQFKPDWLWTQLQETAVIAPEALWEVRRALPKTVVTTWTGDIRAEVPPLLSTICPAVHAVFISSIGHIPIYRAAGAPVCEYLQIGLDWEEDVLGKPDWEPSFRIPDVVFLANFYGDSFPDGTGQRMHAVYTLKEAGIDIGVVGSGWPTFCNPVGACHLKKSYHVYRHAKVALSVNHFNNIEGYWSDRHLMAMASGTPLVSKYIPGLEREFENGKDLFWFKSDSEMIAQVKELLGNEGLRREIGRNGRAKMIRGHSWYSRILGILPTIERIRETL